MSKEGEPRTVWPKTLEVSRDYLDSLIQRPPRWMRFAIAHHILRASQQNA